MAAEYLLDTNIISAIMRGEPRALLNRVAGMAVNRLHLSSIVLAELRSGAERSPIRAKLLADIAEISAGMPALPFDGDAAMAYGHIRTALERKDGLIGAMDMLIAAQAVARGLVLVLVTDNLREFRRVPGLSVENWIR